MGPQFFNAIDELFESDDDVQDEFVAETPVGSDYNCASAVNSAAKQQLRRHILSDSSDSDNSESSDFIGGLYGHIDSEKVEQSGADPQVSVPFSSTALVAAPIDTPAAGTLAPALSHVGAFGQGMHGNAAEKQAMAFYLLKCRATQRAAKRERALKDALQTTANETGESVKITDKGSTNISVIVSKRGKQDRLPLKRVSEIGFAKRFSLCALSSQFNVAKSTIQRCALLAAMAFMYFQIQLLESILSECIAEPPEVAARRLAWDETGEQMTMSIPTCVKGKFKYFTSTWQILVSRITLVVGSLSKGLRFIDIVMPPIHIPTVSAEWLRNGLYWHRLTWRVHNLVHAILETATFMCMRIEEADYASGNDKLVHEMFKNGVIGKATLCLHGWCISPEP